MLQACGDQVVDGQEYEDQEDVRIAHLFPAFFRLLILKKDLFLLIVGVFLPRH